MFDDRPTKRRRGRARPIRQSPLNPGRRAFLRQSFTGMGLLLAGPTLYSCSSDGGSTEVPTMGNIPNLGPLGEPDENGLRLPEGFRSREVARSSEEVAGTGHVWHPAPDGGAVFPADDGGWIYVSNSEHLMLGMGGVGAIRFNRGGDIVDAYPILDGTLRNCAGGPTPWGTWLSCEEFDQGRVWECDPYGESEAAVRDALGVFSHEAVAVDPVHQHLYLTEDVGDGRLYRFAPDVVSNGRFDLSSGTLEVAQVVSGEEGMVEWLPVPDPAAASMPTREQVPESTAFDGGEGIWFHDGVVYFTTKGDNRVWAYDTASATLTVLYDDDRFADPVLTGVDNVTVSPAGDVLVAEDSPTDSPIQIVTITPAGDVFPIVEIPDHSGSEITGPALAPDRRRLYFSSQRGATGNLLGIDGITYEVEGPFFV